LDGLETGRNDFGIFIENVLIELIHEHLLKSMINEPILNLQR